MYKVAFCDDELLELEKIELLLDSYKQVRPEHNISVHRFISVDELLARMVQDDGFDLLLLDIYMPEQTGIAGAKKLREKGIDCPIIFLTASREHAVDAFEVNAVQYLIKPVSQMHFYAAMDKAFEHIKREERRYIALRVEGELRRIALRDIICCEAHGNYQYISLTNDRDVRVRTTLSELHTMMRNSVDFVRVGSAYLINLNHVDSVSAKEVLLDNCRIIGVPRGGYTLLKEQYFNFYCDK